MIKCRLSQDEIMKRMNQKMVNIVTAYNMGDMQLLYAECMSSICGGDEFYDTTSDEIRFSNDDYLEFYVDGRKFWCDTCVSYGLTSKSRVLSTAERWKNGEQFGECSDKYVIWGEYKLKDDDCGVPEHAFVEWYWGADEDLEPGAVVPSHIIEACKKWLKKGE